MAFDRGNRDGERPLFRDALATRRPAAQAPAVQDQRVDATPAAASRGSAGSVAQPFENDPEFEAVRQMVRDLMSQPDGYAPYAGIGSRETPTDVADDMTAMAAKLESRGFTLRSGFAGGADTAFELGTTRDDLREIFAPWKGFGADPNSKYDKPRWDQIRRHERITGKPFVPAKAMTLQGPYARQAEEIASRNHPNWDRLGNGPRMLHSRNVGQVFGPKLDSPVRFELVYTVDGQATGGTGQAMRIAQDVDVPILNLHDPRVRAAILAELEIDRAPAKSVDVARAAAVARSAPKAADGGFDFSKPRVERVWDRATSAVFFQGKDEYGILMNMTPRAPYEDDGVKWKSSEHQYQAGRFPHRPDIQERIHASESAFDAKRLAREFQKETRPDWTEINLPLMAYVVTRRRDANPQVQRLLDQAASKGLAIVEQSSKDPFWGAVERGGVLKGANNLGGILDQAAAGARMDELPPRTAFPNVMEMASLARARLEAESRGEPVPVVRRDVEAGGPWVTGDAPSAAVAASPPRAPSHGEGEGPGAVRYRPGSDVSKMKADVIVNTVNANLSKASQDGSRQEGNPVMGKGVALAFKDLYGDAILRPYAKAIREGSLRAGGVQLLTMPDGQVVANLATKQDWRDESRMEWVEDALIALASEMRKAGHRSVALPPPGCGNGGLDWKDVEPLVLKHLKDFDVTITAAPSSSRITARSGAEIQGVESRAHVLQAVRDEARWRAGREDAKSAPGDMPKLGTRPKQNMGMYFAYGRDRRPGFQAESTFDAILAGERTSTTRFGEHADRLESTKPGDVVRFYERQDFWKQTGEAKGPFVDVVIRDKETIDLAKCSSERLEEWSAVEGWSTEYGRKSGARNGVGVQLRYEVLPGQAIVEERRSGKTVETEGPSLAMQAASRASFGRGGR
jgi:ribA/ribD-fused uncharacterized protein